MAANQAWLQTEGAQRQFNDVYGNLPVAYRNLLIQQYGPEEGERQYQAVISAFTQQFGSGGVAGQLQTAAPLTGDVLPPVPTKKVGARPFPTQEYPSPTLPYRPGTQLEEGYYVGMDGNVYDREGNVVAGTGGGGTFATTPTQPTTSQTTGGIYLSYPDGRTMVMPENVDISPLLEQGWKVVGKAPTAPTGTVIPQGDEQSPDYPWWIEKDGQRQLVPYSEIFDWQEQGWNVIGGGGRPTTSIPSMEELSHTEKALQARIPQPQGFYGQFPEQGLRQALGGQGVSKPRLLPSLGAPQFPSPQSWRNMMPSEQQMFGPEIQTQGFYPPDYEKQWREQIGGWTKKQPFGRKPKTMGLT